jgi:hypothetical protein
MKYEGMENSVITEENSCEWPGWMLPSFCRIVLLRHYKRTWQNARYLSHCKTTWKIL